MTGIYPARCAALAIGALLVAAAPGRAQAPGNGPRRPLALKVGVLFPTAGSKIEPNSADANFGAANPAAFTLGASYDLGAPRAALRPLVCAAFVDVLTEASATRHDHGPFASEGLSGKGTGSGYGAGMMGRLYPIPLSRFYVGAGVGIYPMHAKVTFSPTGPSYSRTETGAGGKLLLGIESRNGAFGEAEWDWLPEVNVKGAGLTFYRSRQSGLRLNAGYRL